MKLKKMYSPEGDVNLVEPGSQAEQERKDLGWTSKKAKAESAKGAEKTAKKAKVESAKGAEKTAKKAKVE